MKVRLLQSALLDLATGREFYKRQAFGLDGYFLDSLSSDIDALALYGGFHRKISGFHRALSKRFPYAIYYKTVEQEVVVFRVLDCRQDPNRSRNALKPD